MMGRDRAVDVTGVQGNRISFAYTVLLSRMPMVMTVMEFGYPPDSESLNGTITSPSNTQFRIPGGTTRTRNPREFWREAKKLLVYIFQQALNG